MTTREINRLYIRAMNEGDGSDVELFFTALVTINPAIRFKKKRYLWNLIRGRGFYTAFGNWIRLVLKDYETWMGNSTAVDNALGLIHDLAGHDRDKKAFKSFAWNLTKTCPILTLDLAPVLSEERIQHILRSKDIIFTDDATKPFVDEIMNLRRTIMNMKEIGG